MVVPRPPPPQLNHQRQPRQLHLEPMDDVEKILVAPPVIQKALTAVAVHNMGTLYIFIYYVLTFRGHKADLILI
jgi:hypothetical protein